MVLKPSTQCATCGAEATMRCLHCLDAPEYQIGDSTVVVYCDSFCQEMHWPKHEGYCKDMQKRKMLLRAAWLLKAAILAYKEIVYDVDLTKVEFKDGVLSLHQNPRPISSGPKHAPFPAHMFNSIEHKEAALVHNQCTAATALLGPLTRRILRGVPFVIETMDIIVQNPPLTTKLIPDVGSHSGTHTVLKIRERGNNDTWIIDTTGCQYGFRDLLVPFNKYFMDKECQVLDAPFAYDAFETKDLDYYSMFPCFTRMKTQRKEMRLERQTRHHFAVFVAKTVGDNFLGGSDIDFEATIDLFVNGLKSHMVQSIRATEYFSNDSDDDDDC
ncbi:hypothetical protein N7457_009277 [Penicillium paradoxum]|uniref:uncharacterized protein n=1 Tax=Penicillium paradoxum TaxID=176176 RepID=UPI0025484370|nr:uncharacterized protein N7457_009277 [Penicillium paradoxum]KAJ5774381.1 hypothetical protein N7457_009277 [Penicillium paradoxum]